ncbi:hypothetical protein JCM10908_001520 [Rhodotorula pacifica]|uniref:uncharacterized protein n=1 Tax=Rhodotorula pacifica TaxID=1495444 RepID=UPI00316C5F1D
MSRYANRNLAPPTASRARTPQPAPRYEDGGYGYRDSAYGPSTDDDDDTTAVATDLSGLKPPERRGVSFGPNEVGEFHGSEAPEAVAPAPSTRHLGERLPTGIGRPRSVSIDGRRRDEPVLPPPPPRQRYVVTDQRIRDDTPEALEMLPPPAPAASRQMVYRRSAVSPAPGARGYDQGYDRSPQSFSRSTASREERTRDQYEYDDPRDDDRMMDDGDGYNDDNDTAVGTGVASELDMDGNSAIHQAAARNRSPVLPQREPTSSFLAVQRPPSRGVQVRKSLLPAPPPAQAPYYGDRPRYLDYPRSVSQSGYDSSDFEYPEVEPPAGLLLRQQQQQQQQQQLEQKYSYREQAEVSSRAGIARPVSSASARMQVDDPVAPVTPVEPYVRPPTTRPEPEDSPLEKELIELLKQLKFSMALKDFHDAMKIGVQKTLVAEDGMGHAYCKVHCKRLPRHEDIEREAHLRNHWIPLAGSRWEFRTASHSVTVVFKTAALAAYEAQFLARR